MADRLRLEKLLAYHQDAAKSIAFVLGLMNGHARETKTATAANTIAAALRVDAGRRQAKTKPGGRPQTTGKGTNTAKLASRKRTAAKLKKFSTEHPARWTGRGVGPLVYHGYLKKADEDSNGKPLYIRTAKAYDASAI